MLNQAPKYAVKIYVGKRAGAHSHSQDDINKMILSYSKLGHVVRLKGGDPFVFGRGFEEMIYSKKVNPEVEVIPGISSTTAVGAWNGLPVTLREISTSFHVFSAIAAKGKFNEELKEIPHLSGTVVILMGFNQLSKIVELYPEDSRPSIGISVIQNGTMRNQLMISGNLENIVYKVRNAGMGTPAIIYIGKVINEYLKNKNLIENGTKESVISSVFQAG